MGMDKLLADLMQKAAANGKKIHVMGAANVGKSSFINRLLESAHTGKKKSRGSKNRAVALKNTAKATVSNLPGTTLDFLKIQLPNGVVMIDTPGLLQKGQLTSKLNSEELRQIIPAKEIKPVTIRMIENKCVLIGGVARVELLQVRQPFVHPMWLLPRYHWDTGRICIKVQ
jgi:ribosome biogenesis GTPase A